MNQWHQSTRQGPNPDAYPGNDPNEMAKLGYVWQPWAMGGGEWVMPPQTRMVDNQFARITQIERRLEAIEAALSDRGEDSWHHGYSEGLRHGHKDYSDLASAALEWRNAREDKGLGSSERQAAATYALHATIDDLIARSKL